MAEGSLARPAPRIGESLADRRRAISQRLPRGDARRQVAWQAAWAPFWLGSDMPRPVAAAANERLPAEVGLAGDVVVLGVKHISRRLWLRHALTILFRAVWLGLTLGCLWLVVELAGGPALGSRELIAVMAVLGVLGIAFAATSRPSCRQTARMLDRTFGLHERISTAVDDLGHGIPRAGERASVIYLQMADAANAIADIRRHRVLGFRLPVREMVLTIFFGLLMAALFFIRGVGGDIPPVAAGAVPVFTPAVDLPPEPEPAPVSDQPVELPPTVEEVIEQSERSNQARQDLQELAQALDDHAVTRSAAEAISQGDYSGAADTLRELAPDADQLSPAAREELARDLDQAAGEMSEASQDLSSAASEAASGLRQGDEAAQQGVRELGEAVERTSNEVASQQELAEQMDRAQAARESGQPSESGASQQGNPGDAGQPGEPGAPQSGGEPGQTAEGQTGQPGAAGDPQSGGDGESNQGEGAPGQEGAQGGQPGQQPGAPDAGQEGGEPGGLAEPGAGGEDGMGDSQQSAQGGGAGSGESSQNGEEGQGGAPAGGGEDGSRGTPAEQRVSEGDGARAESGEPGQVSESISLPPGSGNEGVQTSNDSASSRQGTGAGVTAGSGSAVQGDVGESGPDSNRVPPGYRDVVEAYFSEPGSG